MGEINATNYPPNNPQAIKALNEKNEPKPDKSIKKINAKVTQKKKGIIHRVCENLFEDEIDDVGRYILHDVMIPSFKKMIADSLHGSIDLSLYGNGRSANNVQRSGNKSYVSYNQMYNGQQKPAQIQRNRTRDFDNLIFESRQEAEAALSQLVDLIDTYGTASVADLYEMLSIESKFTDNKWGWTNLSSASVNRVREGYQLNLPKATELL